MPFDLSRVATSVVNHIPAMVAYWDKRQTCRFSNDAYQFWFGKSPEQMVGMHMAELLGPLYEMNLPHIQAALQGEVQVFERRIPLPGGRCRDSIATYTPDIVGGQVLGFSVLVADVSVLREREEALARALREKEETLAQVKELSGLLPICAWCKKIRGDEGYWTQLEQYIEGHSKAMFTHGICPDCENKMAGGL